MGIFFVKFAYMCIYVHHIHAHEDQKRASDALKPELQMVVSLHGVLGTEPGPSAIASTSLPRNL